MNEFYIHKNMSEYWLHFSSLKKGEKIIVDSNTIQRVLGGMWKAQ